MAAAMLMATTVTSWAQNVQKVVIGENMSYGITYSLPQTRLCLVVEATCTTIKAGPFAAFAEKYLGLTDVAKEDSKVWEIKQVKLESEAIPDPSRRYHINFSEKFALPTFFLSDQGLLLSVNAEPNVGEESAEAAASKEGAEANATAAETKSKQQVMLKASDVMSEEMLKAGSKAKQAELVAREIFSIRESRRNLLKGEVDNLPADGASFQLVLDNLDAQERALLTLFQGVVSTTTHERRYNYIPTQATQGDVVFRFSRHYGFAERNDLGGEPYILSLSIVEDLRTPSDDAAADPKAAAAAKKPLPKPVSQGIAYNVPGKVHIELRSRQSSIASTDLHMGQFGHVEQLPVGQFIDKKKLSCAVFNPLTGAIRIFEQQ